MNNFYYISFSLVYPRRFPDLCIFSHAQLLLQGMMAVDILWVILSKHWTIIISSDKWVETLGFASHMSANRTVERMKSILLPLKAASQRCWPLRRWLGRRLLIDWGNLHCVIPPCNNNKVDNVHYNDDKLQAMPAQCCWIIYEILLPILPVTDVCCKSPEELTIGAKVEVKLLLLVLLMAASLLWLGLTLA
jgi:hypothetical protein